ncbi:MAG TPA: ATP-binding protein [Acidimicrobiales bacterium]|nr:ATP-binding protein [Acidimicrobiales bacterium]
MLIDMAVCLPRDAPTVALVRTAITNTLGLIGVDRDCIDDIALAVSEACTNVIQHAATDDEYEVSVHVDDTRCTISVKNTGNGFDAAALAGTMPDPFSTRGRGVAIMQMVMDGIDFVSSPEAGTIVNLVRNLTFREDAPILPQGRGGRPT